MAKSQRQLNKICFKDDVSKPCKNPIKMYKYWFDFSNININTNINIHIFSISILVAIYMKGRFQYQYRYQYFEIADFNINIYITNILVFQYFSIYCPTSVPKALFSYYTTATWRLGSNWKPHTNHPKDPIFLARGHLSHLTQPIWRP